jgi:hypothetical protein
VVAQRSRGIEARSFNCFMRLPRADLMLAAIAAGLSVATVLNFSGIDFALKTRGTGLALFAALFAVGGWWTARTWNQLWRRGRGAWERLVYDSGVRTFGYSTAVSLFIIVTWLGWTADSGRLFGPLMMGGALAGMFFGLPVALHAGYYWGRTFALFVGVERDPRLEAGEPPNLS